ncbi:MAG TPA: hypothetical protein VFA75_20835 [Nevskia sp.]|nr:hypothetical protein [Nevskia sp.]
MKDGRGVSAAPGSRLLRRGRVRRALLSLSAGLGVEPDFFFLPWWCFLPDVDLEDELEPLSMLPLSIPPLSVPMLLLPVLLPPAEGSVRGAGSDGDVVSGGMVLLLGMLPLPGLVPDCARAEPANTAQAISAAAGQVLCWDITNLQFPYGAGGAGAAPGVLPGLRDCRGGPAGTASMTGPQRATPPPPRQLEISDRRRRRGFNRRASGLGRGIQTGFS